MDIYSMMDEKSKENLKRIMDGENVETARPVKKKTVKKENREEYLKHLEEYHFKSGAELLDQIKKHKRVYRGGESGWIALDDKDPNSIASYSKQDNGKMGITLESLDTLKKYVIYLDSTKVDGYIDFWHKKQFRRDGKTEE